MSLIASLESTSHYLYVITQKHVIQRDVLSMREIQRWDLPSPPCSALLLSSRNEDHWSIVCTRHLRTHDLTIAHGFDFAGLSDPCAPITFLSMREIGVAHLPETKTEHCGIRLLHYNPMPTTSDVCQQGSDIVVRQHNSMMERIAHATLLHRDARRGMLVRTIATNDYWLYDRMGRNRRFVTACLPTPAGAPCYAIVGTAAKPMVIVANVSEIGKLEVLDRWWWWVYVRWAFWISITLGILLAFAS